MKNIKLFEQFLNESNDKTYAVVMIGGSAGEKRPQNKRGYKGLDASEEELFSLDDAKKKAKRMNKLLSPGEKKHYGLRYIVIPVKNGIFE